MKKINLLFMIFGLFFLIGCSFTTANFSDLSMASSVDVENNTPINKTSTFTSTSPVIYVTGKINNAPEDTMMKIEWIYLDTSPETFITDYEMEAINTNSNFYFQLTRPTAGWQKGNYEARLYIDDTLEETLSFTVE